MPCLQIIRILISWSFGIFTTKQHISWLHEMNVHSLFLCSNRGKCQEWQVWSYWVGRMWTGNFSPHYHHIYFFPSLTRFHHLENAIIEYIKIFANLARVICVLSILTDLEDKIGTRLLVTRVGQSIKVNLALVFCEYLQKYLRTYSKSLYIIIKSPLTFSKFLNQLSFKQKQNSAVIEMLDFTHYTNQMMYTCNTFCHGLSPICRCDIFFWLIIIIIIIIIRLWL